MKVLHLIQLLCFFLIVHDVTAQIPTLPEGAHTKWRIGEPEEIVTWILFDPATVEDRLPSKLRFITVEELAENGIGWANDYISDHSSRGHWGISFLEIAHMKSFSIDGETPSWPNNGAIALWFARVAPTDPTIHIEVGQPFLALNFWLPDSIYAKKIQEKGHYATYGNVTLEINNEEKWHGTVENDGLQIVGECLPGGPVRGGETSSGMQTIFPPKSSDIKSVVRIAFAGHRIQKCGSGGSWSITGNHPLVKGVILEPTEFQFGYELIGGAYSW